jgi:hypothetical protein
VIGAMNSARRFDIAAEDSRWRGIERRYLPPAGPVGDAGTGATASVTLSFAFP